MHDEDLQALLLAEVPSRRPDYWATVDDAVQRTSLTALGSSKDSEDQVVDITANEMAPAGAASAPSRSGRWRWLVAAGLLVVAGLVASTQLRDGDSQRVEGGFAVSPVQPLDPAELDGLPGPQQNLDHWHAVYGVWDCTANDGSGDWVPAFQSTRDDSGLHSHEDGVIHIHPFYEWSAGENATFGLFANEMGFTMTESAITLDDGRVLSAGAMCEGEPAVVHLRRWQHDVVLRSDLNAEPRVITSGFDDERFYNNREVWTIALAPLDAYIPPPPADRFRTLDNEAGGVPLPVPEEGSVVPVDQAYAVPVADRYVRSSQGFDADVAVPLFEARLRAQAAENPAVFGSVAHIGEFFGLRQRFDVFSYRSASEFPRCLAILPSTAEITFGSPGAQFHCGTDDELDEPRLGISAADQTTTVWVEAHDMQPHWLVVVTEDGTRIASNFVGGFAMADVHESLGTPTQVWLLDRNLDLVWNQDLPGS